MKQKRVPPASERADRPHLLTANRLSIRIVEEYNALYSITDRLIKNEIFRDYIAATLFRAEKFINEVCTLNLSGDVAYIFGDLIALYEKISARVDIP